MRSLALFIRQYSHHLAHHSLSPSIHCQCQSIRCYLCSLSYSNSNRLRCSHKQSVSNNSSRELDSSTLCQIHFGAQSDGGDLLFSLLLPLHCTACQYSLIALSLFFIPQSFSLFTLSPSTQRSASPETS